MASPPGSAGDWVNEIRGIETRWCGRAPAPGAEIEVGAQVRAHGEEVPAIAQVDAGTVRVTLRRAIRGVAPGQSIVLYQGTRVLGSATIAQATRS